MEEKNKLLLKLIKFSSKLMRQFDVVGKYYSQTVRCDGNVFTMKEGGDGGVPP